MKYRKKPIVIEAIRYMPHENCAEVAAFLGQDHHRNACLAAQGNDAWMIETLEGAMECRPGDWVLRGIAGEYYICKDAIFRQTHEAVEDPPEEESVTHNDLALYAITDADGTTWVTATNIHAALLRWAEWCCALETDVSAAAQAWLMEYPPKQVVRVCEPGDFVPPSWSK